MESHILAVRQLKWACQVRCLNGNQISADLQRLAYATGKDSKVCKRTAIFGESRADMSNMKLCFCNFPTQHRRNDETCGPSPGSLVFFFCAKVMFFPDTQVLLPGLQARDSADSGMAWPGFRWLQLEAIFTGQLQHASLVAFTAGLPAQIAQICGRTGRGNPCYKMRDTKPQQL